MKKRILFLVFILLVVIFIVGFKKYQDIYRSTDNYQFLTDYNISLKSKVTYVNGLEALDVFNKERAILYIGDKEEELCQQNMAIFTNVIDKYDIINFYYLDISNELPLFQINDDKVSKVKDGSESYYKLIEYLDSVLNEKVILENNKEYKCGEKEIKLPFVITIEDGKILNYHEGLIKDEFDEKDNELRLKLTDIYSDMIVELIR